MKRIGIFTLKQQQEIATNTEKYHRLGALLDELTKQINAKGITYNNQTASHIMDDTLIYLHTEFKQAEAIFQKYDAIMRAYQSELDQCTPDFSFDDQTLEARMAIEEKYKKICDKLENDEIEMQKHKEEAEALFL